MVYNYIVHVGESFNIKTPGNHTLNDIVKNIKSDESIIINDSLYPDGFKIKMTQLANKIIITTNKELIKNSDGSYSIKD